MKLTFTFPPSLFLAAIMLLALSGNPAIAQDFSQHVNPMIGTGAHGHTYPGPCRPFGMVQLSPDTRLEGWDGCSGYHDSDRVIYGFSHTHLSGTGVPDYGDILLMPVNRKDAMRRDAYQSKFSKDQEKAEAGYYRVKLDDPGVLAELTSTMRVGMHRYTFPSKAADPGIVLDLDHRDKVIDASWKWVSDTEIEGYRISTSWAREQHVYFVIRFDKVPVRSASLRSENGHLGQFAWPAGTRQVQVKVALSGVSTEGARRNLDAELSGWEFDQVVKQSKQVWNQTLSRFQVSGGTPDQLKVFYTAVYHSMLAPNLWSDVDGQYRAMDRKVRTSEHPVYTVFSLWDTFRAAHPLYTLVDPERAQDFVRTLLLDYKSSGKLPVWELAANETNCMIGYHSVSVILDAWMKGLRGFDGKLALEAMVASARQPSLDENNYTAGYILADKESESVSKALEYAYDDWCIAMMAHEMGEKSLEREFARRSMHFMNHFDPETGFMRARKNGGWVQPFDPAEVNVNYTEANAWQYSFFVPHQVQWLAKHLGGEDKFELKLDQLFNAPSRVTGREQADITGLIGQYAHGNEPSHHIAYLYNWTQSPWKTQVMAKRIMDELYHNAPDGLCGNEDCGQMSAWYVWSALGMYPVCPGDNRYAIGYPLFPSATLRLPNGKTFTIVRKGKGAYVGSVSLNGNNYNLNYLTHSMLEAGGLLEFSMSDKPSAWGTGSIERPLPLITNKDLLPTPFVTDNRLTFTDSIRVEVKGIAVPGSVIQYELLDAEGNQEQGTYSEPLTFDRDVHLTILSKTDKANSYPADAHYRKKRGMVRQVSLTAPSSQYSGDGTESLIDGIYAGDDFRMGSWLGWQGQDVSGVFDLGVVRPVSEVRLHALENQRSWIFYPTFLEVEISEDGKNYQSLGRPDGMALDAREEERSRWLSVKGSGVARYVRITVKSAGKLPAWHLSAGSPSWIFADELEIR